MELFKNDRGFISEKSRVLDITDDRWAHPEVRDIWAIINIPSPSEGLWNPLTPIEEKRKVGAELQKAADEAFLAMEHTCEVTCIWME